MFKRVLLAAAFAVTTMGAAQAATLNFTFTFKNTANGGGTVTGIVRGLQDNATGAASSVEILSNTDGFGLGEYIGDPVLNSFVVTAGVITKAQFTAFGARNFAPAVTDSTLLVSFGVTSESSVGLTNDSIFVLSRKDTGIAFTRVEVTPVPVPAALPLLLGGLGAMALVRRRAARRAA